MFITQRSSKRCFLLLLITSVVATLAVSVVAPTYAQIPPAGEENAPALTKEEQADILDSLPPSTFLEGEENAHTPGAVDCFDYYTFGSVQVDVAPTLEQTIPGTPLTFTGKIRNDNAYPVVDGQVYVKIFKHDGSSEALVKENGLPLVAFFLAKDHLTLKANSEQSLTIDWQVPEALSGGTYTAAYFFTTAHRYNLLGLSFTDDVREIKQRLMLLPLIQVALLLHGIRTR